MASRIPVDIDRDRKLILQIAGGSQAAFKKIFDLYHERIFHFTKRYLRADYLVEEALQDLFLKLWEKRTELTKVDDFPAWFFQLSRNHVLNVISKASTENKIKEEIRNTLEDSTEQENMFVFEKENIEKLGKLIAMLPSQRRQIFNLCRLEEKSYDEAAGIMGISKSTVNDHMVKAMKYLKSNFPKKIYD